MSFTLAEARAADAADPLRPLRDRFHLPEASSISTAIRWARCRRRRRRSSREVVDRGMGRRADPQLEQPRLDRRAAARRRQDRAADRRQAATR